MALECLAGVHSEIAAARNEYWSSFAPLPVEVVLAAGQKAKDENSLGKLFLDSSVLLERLFYVFLSLGTFSLSPFNVLNSEQ